MLGGPRKISSDLRSGLLKPLTKLPLRDQVGCGVENQSYPDAGPEPREHPGHWDYERTDGKGQKPQQGNSTCPERRTHSIHARLFSNTEHATADQGKSPRRPPCEGMWKCSGQPVFDADLEFKEIRTAD